MSTISLEMSLFQSLSIDDEGAERFFFPDRIFSNDLFGFIHKRDDTERIPKVWLLLLFLKISVRHCRRRFCECEIMLKKINVNLN